MIAICPRCACVARDKKVFSKVAARVGMERVRLMITGSAPIAAHVMDFLRIVFRCVPPRVFPSFP
jgi:long-subunit acyl-CoA synthetase (AMP-forming)